MLKLAALAIIPLFAGYLCAQETTETRTTTTKTWNGTLVDAGCQATHTEHKETTTKNPDRSVTTRTEHTETVECPVITSTSSFGLLTADGQYIRFDDPSNTKIIEMVKSNKKWNKYITDRAPLRVSVVGSPHGDVVVLESIR